MIQTIRQYLENADFHYNFDEEKQCFDFGLNVENGSVRVRLLARPDEEYMMCYVSWEGRVPVHSVPAILPILNEINFNTKFTSISVDPSDGELSCHCGINFDDSQLTVKQVEVALHVSVRTLDDNMPRIMRAAWSAPANSDGKYN